jgi:YHS domain-containing protein
MALKLFLWTLLLLIVARILVRFVHAVLEGAGVLRDPRERSAVKLVRDPVCGIFVTPSRALTAGSGSKTRYFCSEKCREQWDGK